MLGSCMQLFCSVTPCKPACLVQANIRIAALDAMPGRRLDDKDMQGVRGWLDGMEAFIRATREELI